MTTSTEQRRAYAVLGSTGKATTCYLLDHLLGALGRSTAVFSTVELKVGSEWTPVERGVDPDLQDLLSRADDLRIDDTILELRWPHLREHALGDRAVDVAAFTHLDRAIEGDHAREHFDAIAALLTSASTGIVLVDDDAGRALASRVPGAITVGHLARGIDADWQVSLNASRTDHIDFSVTHRDGRSVSTSLWLPTRFSVGFAALALVVAMETGTAGNTISALLPDGLRPVVPGRVERVADHPRCIVDIAHNPARLSRVLVPLRRTTAGELVAVVAARGLDDPQTRRAVGAAATAADRVVVTDDDYGPDDDPAQIRADVRDGAQKARPEVAVVEVPSRGAAIRHAVQHAGRDDTVLVAGRGHLSHLRTGGEVVHLDDREEVRAGIALRHADAR